MNSIAMLLMWIVIGGIVGWAASMMIRTTRKQGPLYDAAFGAAGGVVGGFVVAHFFAQRLGEQLLLGSVGGVAVGAVAFVALWRLASMPRTAAR